LIEDGGTDISLTVGSTRTAALDAGLELFLRRPPLAADHLVVTMVGFDRLDVVADTSKSEVLELGAELADQLILSTKSLALNERKECRFRATWQQSDRVLGSYAWRAGEPDIAPELDGSMQSMLAQNQRHLETLMRAVGDESARIQRASESKDKAYEKRIAGLEDLVARQADEIRRLRENTGDGDLAREELAAHLESKARTQEIFLQRLLPIAEALLLKQGAAADGVGVAELANTLGLNGQAKAES
jgi:hypothetical protein